MKNVNLFFVGLRKKSYKSRCTSFVGQKNEYKCYLWVNYENELVAA